MNPQQGNNVIFTLLICGGAAGLFCGLVAYAVCASKKRQGLGAAAVIACLISGMILGLLLAVPVAIVFIVIALAMGEPESEKDRFRSEDFSDYDDRMARRRMDSAGDPRGHWREGAGGAASTDPDLMQRAGEAFRSGRYDEAIGLYQQVVNDPNSAKDHDFARRSLETLHKKKSGLDKEEQS
jgi:hypothetical protein